MAFPILFYNQTDTGNGRRRLTEVFFHFSPATFLHQFTINSAINIWALGWRVPLPASICFYGARNKFVGWD
jgi:hypothetical protein